MTSVLALHVLAALRLMTYNVNYGNPDPSSALDTIEATDADVVLLQEITAEWQRLLEKRFAKRYAHQSYRLHTRAAGGLAILSKLPIKSEEVLQTPIHGWFPASRIVVETAFGAVQLLNVHLRPAVDGGSWIKGFITTRSMRRKEIESYWQKLAKNLPTVIAGDFNEDPSGRALEFLVDKGLRRVATKGPTTWFRGPLKLDIDHVVIDGALAAKDGVVLDAGKSDHRPVVVTIEPKP